MHKYILKRLMMMIPVIIGVSIIVFFLMYITPGDPATIILGDNATDADIELLREQLGLNKPFIERYFTYMGGVFTRGDLGTSYTTGQSVTSEIVARFPTTFYLSLVSMIVATVIAIPAGIISATKQYSIFDNAATAVSLVGVSMPNFWQGLMVI